MLSRRLTGAAVAALLAGAALAACGTQGPATTKNYIDPGPPLPSLNTPSSSPLPVYNSPGASTAPTP